MPKPPISKHKCQICVICEGVEEKEYFQHLMQLKVWSSAYEFSPKNARGASTIPAMFEDVYQNNRYDLILVFCDTDKYPYREYTQVKKKINRFFGKQKATEKLVIFANPCTMQIILSHFGEVSLKNQGKKTNAAVIEALTGIRNYDAHEEQIKALCSQILKPSYSDMKERASAICFSDTTVCSTNFIRFLERFENDNIRWIDDIRTYLRK